jgi:hypothetical protein
MRDMVNYCPSSLGVERTIVRVHEHEHIPAGIRLPAGMDDMDWPHYLIEITLLGIDHLTQPTSTIHDTITLLPYSE